MNAIQQFIRQIPPVRPEDFLEADGPEPGYRRIERVLEEIGLAAGNPSPVEVLLQNLGVLKSPADAGEASSGFGYPRSVLHAYGWDTGRHESFAEHPVQAAIVFERIRLVLLETTDAQEILKRSHEYAA